MEFFKIDTAVDAIELTRIMPSTVALDTEYVKGNPRTTKLLSVIIADDTRAWMIDPSLLPLITPAIRARKLIFLQDYNHCDTTILYANGCDIRDCNTFNLIDAHHLLDENAEHSLDARVFNEWGDNYKAEFWDKYKNFEDAPEDEALEYGCKDGIYTYRLGCKDATLLSQSGLTELFTHVQKTSRALLDTELEGLHVNEKLINQTLVDMGQKIDGYLPKLRSEYSALCKIWEFEKLLEKLNKLTSERGKLNAKGPKFEFTDKQLVWLLYTGLGLPVFQLTPKKRNPKTGKVGGGNPSVDYDALQELRMMYPEIKSIFEYKEIKSIYSTFVKGMAERIENGKIYPHFNVSGTKTGRISHTDPNMGNLPKEGVIRNFFIPSPGYVLIGADYAQLEVVIELNLTDDPGLKEIVVGGKSKHDLFKDDLDKAGFNIPRSQVKNINFALQYGAGEFKIAKMVDCSKETAKTIIETFYNRFSGVKNLKDLSNVNLAKYGRVTNLAGRNRRFSNPKNEYEKAKQQRQAYNFLIQGVAGEACNRAYYRYHTRLKELGWGKALFSVHDEIVAEVLPERVTEGQLLLKTTMEDVTKDFNFKYPLQAATYGPLAFWSKT